MRSTSTSIAGERRKGMFSIMELRLIRYCVSNTLKDYRERLQTVDPESDESIELGNDSMILETILEKIADKPEV